MQDGRHRGMTGRAVGGPVAVSDFAAEVVARLIARDSGGPARLREELVQRLLEAVCTTDRQAFEALKPDLKRARISAAMLADLYIPEVARRLGAGWECDTISFAAVSMGAARLQGILREIGAGWCADEDGERDGPTVLMLVPEGEQHTLGAAVATARLRRMGVSVCLRIGLSGGAVRELFAGRGFDAVMISAACTDKLEACRKMVKTLKDMPGRPVPVALGGALVHLNKEDALCLGADIVTNDLEAALQACGLSGSVIRAQKRA